MSAIEASSVNVKTMADNTLRLTVDIEPRFANDAFRLFGVRGTPLALAALKTAAQQEQEPMPKGGELAKLAGQLCKARRFQAWMERLYAKHMGGIDVDMRGEALARHAILVLCDIESRRDLDHDTAAAERFHTLIRKPFSQT